MSVSGLSFWQQDQSWRSRAQALDQQLSDANSLSSTMITALTNQTTGLASIANQQALNRVNGQIKAATSSNANASASSSTTSGGSGSSSASKSPTSSATNLSSTATAASLLSGQIPSGSLLSILA